MPTAPTLRRHCRGNWYVRLTPALQTLAGDKSAWFGRDEVKARQSYRAWAESLGLSLPAEGRENGSLTRGPSSKAEAKKIDATSRERSAIGPMPKAGDNPKTVQAVAESLWALVDAESGEHGRRKVRACLVRPLAAWGAKLASDVTQDDLIRFKSKLASELQPNSANDVLVYTRRLLSHAFEIDAIAAPFKLGSLKNLPRPALLDKTASIDKLKELLRLIAVENPNLARAMLLQFYVCGRPSEIPKLIHATEDQWETENVCAFAGKTTKKTQQPRRMIVSETALSVLAKIERKYHKRGKRIPNGYAYRHLAWKVGEKLKEKHPHAKALIVAVCGRETLYPHRMRHHCVQAMIDLGISEDHRKMMLGRIPPRADRTYGVRPNCLPTLKAVEVLADLIRPSIIDVPKAKGKGRKQRKAA